MNNQFHLYNTSTHFDPLNQFHLPLCTGCFEVCSKIDVKNKTKCIREGKKVKVLILKTERKGFKRVVNYEKKKLFQAVK